MKGKKAAWASSSWPIPAPPPPPTGSPSPSPAELSAKGLVQSILICLHCHLASCLSVSHLWSLHKSRQKGLTCTAKQGTPLLYNLQWLPSTLTLKQNFEDHVPRRPNLTPPSSSGDIPRGIDHCPSHTGLFGVL